MAVAVVESQCMGHLPGQKSGCCEEAGVVESRVAIIGGSTVVRIFI